LDLNEHPPETHKSYAEEEEESEGSHYTAVAPYHIEIRSMIRHGLGEADEVGR